MNPNGAVFLVTGAASGLGAASVAALTAAGAIPFGFDLHKSQLDERQSATGDVTNEGDVRVAIARALATFGRIDGLIACAGVAVSERAVTREGAAPLGSFVRALEVNVVGTFNVVRLVAETISQQEAPSEGSAGVIVMTSSIAAFDGQVGQAAYAASKGAIAAMTLPLAREFASFRVRVASIAPGLFDTPMLQGIPPEARLSLAGQPAYPKRFGRPDEFAALALHIVENEMINGETIRLDGGLRMAAR